MPNDIFSGLGGLMKGLSGIMPQDDPNVKLMNAQTELGELKQQETDLLAEIGRLAFAADPGAYPQAGKLRLVQSNLAEAQSKLDGAKRVQEETKALKDAEDAKGRCPNCGHQNAEGVKFCQECGGKLGSPFCQSCGAAMQPGIRFCGECGAKQGD